MKKRKKRTMRAFFCQKFDNFPNFIFGRKGGAADEYDPISGQTSEPKNVTES